MVSKYINQKMIRGIRILAVGMKLLSQRPKGTYLIYNKSNRQRNMHTSSLSTNACRTITLNPMMLSSRGMHYRSEPKLESPGLQEGC